MDWENLMVDILGFTIILMLGVAIAMISICGYQSYRDSVHCLEVTGYYNCSLKGKSQEVIIK